MDVIRTLSKHWSPRRQEVDIVLFEYVDKMMVFAVRVLQSRDVIKGIHLVPDLALFPRKGHWKNEICATIMKQNCLNIKQK